MYRQIQRLSPLFVLLVLSSAIWLGAWGCDGSSRRVVYHGGPVITMDDQDRVVEALGIEGDRIRAVGSLSEVMSWAGAGAEQVDLAGKALLPGFIDAHGHFPGAGMFVVFADLNSPPIGQVKTMDDLVAQLVSKARDTDEGDWVMGMGYDDTILAEKRHPTREDLDRVSTRHPVVAWHISLHILVLNSRGLEELGIDADTPDPEGGLIRRIPGTRDPDGVLEETAGELLIGANLEPSILEGIAMIREAGDLYLAAGVTTAQSGMAEQGMMQALLWASRLGMVPVRLVLFPSPDATDAMLDGDFDFKSYDESWVRAGAVKIIADGSIQGYTGYLSEPYAVPPGDDPDYRGYPRTPRDELLEMVARYHAAGLQIAVHGNGDASIDDILDAYEQAQAASPREDSRHIVIHAQMAREDQLDRMAELGVIPSFFILHTYYWGDRHRDIFMGPERAARMSPARSALDRGIRMTLHADSPVVPMEPLRIVWSAVNRITSSGAELGPEQRISVQEALRGVTIDAARQHFEDGEKGSLEVGKLADLVILSRSPFDSPETIDEIEVVETVIGGRSLYRAE